MASTPPLLRIVLACSNGYDTPAAVPWLREQYGAEVVAVTVDAEAGRELEAVRNRALAAGAVRAHVIDVRDEFAHDFLVPALKAGVLADIGALSRPLVARQLVAVAAIEHAGAVAFADPAPASLDSMIHALNAAIRTIHVPVTGNAPYAAALRTPHERATEPASLDIAFERGVPVSLNGIAMPVAELLGSLGTIAGAHGVIDVPRLLQAAHHAVQARVADADVARMTRTVEHEYAAIVADGRWFSALREALDAFVNHVQQRVSGTAHVQLQAGGWTVAPAATPDGGAPGRPTTTDDQ